MPNPFARRTRFQWQIPVEVDVHLCVYDITGREVRKLWTGKAKPGKYSLAWDGSDDHGRRVPAGIYICRMNAGTFAGSRKLVLTR